MTPCEAIERADELVKEINRIVHSIALESDDIREQWQGLGHAGGQRDDHAAVLLGRLRPALAELGMFASSVEKQIDGMVRDPFGRESN